MLSFEQISGQHPWQPQRALPKVVLGLLCLLLSLVVTSRAAWGLLFSLPCALLWGKARVPILAYLKVLTLPLIFLLFSCLGILLEIQGQPHLALNKMPLVINLCLRAMTCVNALYFMLFTVPMNKILATLRQAHVPPLFITLMNLVYRCIHILLEVAKTKRDSMHCRGGFIRGKRGRHNLGLLWGAVFYQSMEKSRKLQEAMSLRGHKGTLKFLPSQDSLTKKEWLAAIGLVLITLSLNHYFP